MPYVMVPVPEEHVQEAMEAVLRITNRAKLTDWDAASIEQFFGEIDESSRSLLSVVARAHVSGKPVSQQNAADLIQLSQRETVGIMRDVNDLARDQSRPVLLITRQTSETLPNGRTRDVNVFSMTSECAEFIRNAEKAELASGRNPLSGIEG